MSKISDDALEALRAEHGEVVKCSFGGGADDVVIRKCKAVEFKRFRSRAYNEKQRENAMEEIVRATIVFPPRDEVQALFETYPGIPEGVAGEVLRMAGAADVDIKK